MLDRSTVIRRDMDRNLARLNQIPREDALVALSRCCGSHAWVDQMIDGRPFSSVEALHALARDAWWSLGEDDWLEAFASHPQIGDRDVVSNQRVAGAWERREQAGAADSDPELAQRLAVLNERYRARFGFIFIICATGKSAAEMLANLESRLHHDRGIELRVAAEEQRLITEIRLNKLLVELARHA